MNQARWYKAVFHLNRLPEVINAIAWTGNWWLLIRAYLKVGKIIYPFKLTSRSGLKFQIDNYHDCVTAWVVFCRQEYIVSEDANIILDLGANFGAFTLFAADMAKNSHIFSIEPFPRSFARLNENIKLNGMEKRVTCLPLAVASGSGEGRMSAEENVPDQSRGLMLEDDLFAGDNVISVKTITLAEILKLISLQIGINEIDLVKMDIEGGEHEWFPKLHSETLKSIHSWQMEYHPSGSKDGLFRVLESAGFYCVKDVESAPNSGIAHFKRKSITDL